MRPTEYEYIAKKITNLFPKENGAEYYSPSLRKRERNCKSAAYQQGKLVNKVRNIIYRCEEAVPLRIKKRKLNNSTDVGSTDDEPENNEIGIKISL